MFFHMTIVLFLTGLNISEDLYQPIITSLYKCGRIDSHIMVPIDDTILLLHSSYQALLTNIYQKLDKFHEHVIIMGHSIGANIAFDVVKLHSDNEGHNSIECVAIDPLAANNIHYYNRKIKTNTESTNMIISQIIHSPTHILNNDNKNIEYSLILGQYHNLKNNCLHTIRLNKMLTLYNAIPYENVKIYRTDKKHKVHFACFEPEHITNFCNYLCKNK